MLGNSLLLERMIIAGLLLGSICFLVEQIMKLRRRAVVWATAKESRELSAVACQRRILDGWILPKINRARKKGEFEIRIPVGEMSAPLTQFVVDQLVPKGYKMRNDWCTIVISW